MSANPPEKKLFSKVYLDMDGVLADFDGSFFERFGVEANVFEAEYGSTVYWEKVYEDPRFFENLKPFSDITELTRLAYNINNWDETNDVAILSSPSRVNTPLCMLQKRTWIDKHLGYSFPAIFESQKHKYAGPGKLLVDDTEKKIKLWEGAGGVGHHYKSLSGFKTWLKEYKDTH